MANFEDTANVTTPYTDVVKLTILQRRNDCIEAMEHWKKMLLQDFEIGDHIFRSRLYSLWLEINAGFDESKASEQFKEDFGELILSKKTDGEALVKYFKALDKYIYSTRLTKIANFKKYDTSVAEAENEANQG